jgi:hypothetical protein
MTALQVQVQVPVPSLLSAGHVKQEAEHQALSVARSRAGCVPWQVTGHGSTAGSI